VAGAIAGQGVPGIVAIVGGLLALVAGLLVFRATRAKDDEQAPPPTAETS